MGDKEDVAVLAGAHGGLVPLAADLGDEAVEALRDLLGALSAGAAVAPNVPVGVEALLGAAAADLGARDALVVAVVPLADVVGDLDAGAADEGARVLRAVGRPGEGVLDAEVEELKGALGALPGGDVAAGRRGRQRLASPGS